jgi:hypothetical protein
MGTEQSSTQGAPKNISRRRVVAGAAWSVPAVMVASAAPAVAASKGPLEFTGGACKLPGNANEIFKGYVFELIGTNTLGPDPLDAVTVISNVRVNGQLVTGFQVRVMETLRNGSEIGACTCGTCTPGTVCNSFCTPENSTQRILVYTNTQENSRNTSFSLDYQRYECSTCTPVGPLTHIATPGTVDTPPDTSGGGSCDIVGAVPAPPLSPACAGPA